MKTLKHLLAALALVAWPSDVFAFVSCPKGTWQVKEYKQRAYYIGIMPDSKTLPSSLAECIGARNPEFGYMSFKCGDITLKKHDPYGGGNDFIEDRSVNVEAKSGGVVNFRPVTVKKMEKYGEGTLFEGEEMTTQIAYWCVRGVSGGPNGASLIDNGTIKADWINSDTLATDLRSQNKCTTTKQSGEMYFLQTSFGTIWGSDLTDKFIFGHSLHQDGAICRKTEVF
ncbi:hypothetical protein FZX09_10815 [Synechococcus sp. MU1643]|uniref:hypothetical protein n=1 Tax=Synechococcus sp. MU1643 TaxID=2508349 RepID=UPI001CF919BF|nr:hypothetical protein [Synechococcus sp. MU1643]MCB4429264.1 hypothetical protein [Synechococcus sp. MU1643]